MLYVLTNTKLVRVTLASALLTGCALPVMADQVDSLPVEGSARAEECQPSLTCPMTYEYLSNQDDDPFLFNGKIMNEEHPRWHQYEETLARFPKVKDCLLEGYDTNPVNLYAIDWDNVGTGRGAEVCTFRIFRSLANLERVTEWLRLHDFRVSEPSDSGGEPPLVQLHAYWTVEQYREKKPSFLAYLGIDFVYGYTLSIRLDPQDRVIGAAVATSSK